MEGSEVETEHGPGQVCYSLSGVGAHWPYLRCLCGWESHLPSWAEVGEDFDEHLAGTKGKDSG